MRAYGNVEVALSRNKRTGERSAIIAPMGKAPTHSVPLMVASFAAGKDAWMRKIHAKCSYCETVVTVDQMEADHMCPDCYEKEGEEIAKMDGRG